MTYTHHYSLNRRNFLRSAMAGTAGTALTFWARSVESAELPMRGTKDQFISLSGRIESRQLLNSILSYVGSDKFNPEQSLDHETLEKIFKAAL